MSERELCQRCHRLIGVYVPRGGDGSAVRLRRHRRGQHRDEPWCEGSGQLLPAGREQGSETDG